MKMKGLYPVRLVTLAAVLFFGAGAFIQLHAQNAAPAKFRLAIIGLRHGRRPGSLANRSPCKPW